MAYLLRSRYCHAACRLASTQGTSWVVNGRKGRLMAEGAAVTLHPMTEGQMRLGGIGKTKTYALIAAGELEVVHIGRRAFIPSDSIDAFIERCRSRQPSETGPAEGGDAA